MLEIRIVSKKQNFLGGKHLERGYTSMLPINLI